MGGKSRRNDGRVGRVDFGGNNALYLQLEHLRLDTAPLIVFEPTAIL